MFCAVFFFLYLFTSVYLCTDKSRTPRSPRVWLPENKVKLNTSELKYFQNIFKCLANCSVTLKMGKSDFHFSWPQSFILGPFDMMHTKKIWNVFPKVYSVDRGGILFRVLLQVLFFFFFFKVARLKHFNLSVVLWVKLWLITVSFQQPLSASWSLN